MRVLLFECIHFLVTRFPRIVVFISLLTAVLAGWYGIEKMEMITDQDRLLSEDLPYHARYMKFIREFGDLEFLYVVIEGPTEKEMISFADSLAARLRGVPDVKKVIYSFDTAWVKDYAFSYASEDELQKLYTEIQPQKDKIQELYSTRTVDEILQRITDQLGSPQSMMTGASPVLQDQMQVLLDALNGKKNTSFSRFSELQDEINKQTERKYIWAVKGKTMIMLVMPNKDYSTLSVIEQPLKKIRDEIEFTKLDHPKITAGLTGRPALQADEMSTSNRDMIKSSIVAFFGVAIVFMIFFKELMRPIICNIVLLIATGWTYGFIALTLGHLNLLSVVFALVLIGLGVDYGIHFIHRYQEELELYGSPSEAIRSSLVNSGSGIMTGAFTSTIAFSLAMTTKFKGLAELGYVAGAGILLSLLAMLVTLPAALMVYDHHFRRGTHIPQPLQLIGLRHTSRHPRTVILILFIITIALLPQLKNLKFDDNLLNMQADGLESVAYEKKLLKGSGHSTWYCAFVRKDLEQVKALQKQLQQFPTVAATESLLDVLPSITPAKKEKIDAIRSFFTGIEKKPAYSYEPNLVISNQLIERIQNLSLKMEQMKEQKVRMMAAAAKKGSKKRLTPQQMAAMQQMANAQAAGAVQDASNDSSVLFAKLTELATLLSGTKEECRDRLIKANQILLDEPRAAITKLSTMVNKGIPPVEEIPDIFRSMYVGKDKSYLVMAYPKENIWETEPMKRFVDDLRKADPFVTGAPIQVYESSQLMRDSFIRIALMAYIAVGILIFLDFLSIKHFLMILVPLTLGIVWMVEYMGLRGIYLNLANFFAIPILIGIGIEEAIYFYHRYLEEHDVDKALYTTGTGLTLTSLTNILGFGSLILASHKGLRSFGILMSLGTIMYWFAAVVLLPSLIKIVDRKHSAASRRLKL